MIANIIYECAETFRLAQTTILAQDLQNPGKGFLANIVYGMGRLKPRPKLEFKQCGEISNKMLLRLEVSSAECVYVLRMERMELQGSPRSRKIWVYFPSRYRRLKAYWPRRSGVAPALPGRATK